MMQHVVFVYGINLMFAKGLVADLTAEQMIQVARNSFVASFLPDAEQQEHLDAIDTFAR